MSILDRKIAPGSLPIEAIKFLDVKVDTLQNGINVYQINAGAQNVVKLELIFEAGQWNCSNPLLGDFTNRMLIEGSARYSSSEIAEKFDYLGAFTNFECGKHFASVQLFCLDNFFEQSLEVFESYVKFPSFPGKEFNIHIKNEHQQYILEREKTEVLAADEFYKQIFGPNHPYGMSVQADDFFKLTTAQMKAHHKNYYHPANCKIVLAGKLDERMLSLLDTHFGANDWGVVGQMVNKEFAFENEVTGSSTVKKQGAVQASIKMGKKTIGKKDSDYHGLSILNTVLGGYFGSRLMSNLREKNALTYGIYSSLSSLLYAGVFSITANVRAEQSEYAVSQIINEVNVLREQLIPEQELTMVKNYLRGEMLRAFDGPLPLSEIYAGLLNFNLDFNYYQDLFNTIETISPVQLRELANKYLNPETFVHIIAGDF